MRSLCWVLITTDVCAFVVCVINKRETAVHYLETVVREAGPPGCWFIASCLSDSRPQKDKHKVLNNSKCEWR